MTREEAMQKIYRIEGAPISANPHHGVDVADIRTYAGRKVSVHFSKRFMVVFALGVECYIHYDDITEIHVQKTSEGWVIMISGEDDRAIMGIDAIDD